MNDILYMPGKTYAAADALSGRYAVVTYIEVRHTLISYIEDNQQRDVRPARILRL